MEIESITTRLYEKSLVSTMRLENQIETINATETTTSIVSEFFKGMKTSLATFGDLLFSLLLSLYVAVSLKDYFAAVVRAFPLEQRENAAHVLSKCASTLRLWFRAQVIDMSIIGVMTAAGLWLVDVDYWAV
jgi:predicted PurR-regulated permease PerM